jgi:hypothetical protein
MNGSIRHSTYYITVLLIIFCKYIDVLHTKLSIKFSQVGSSLLRYNAVYSVETHPAFWETISLQSSESTKKLSKNLT